MGTTNPKHSHGGLKAAFAQQSFRNIRGSKDGVCTMHTPKHDNYYPKWDHTARHHTIIPNLLAGESAYGR